MELGHIHIGFKNLQTSITWMKQMLDKEPTYQDTNMAVFTFEQMSLVFDKAEEDAAITVAFNSQNCDQDFAKLIKRDAEVMVSPTDQSWGVRAAYIKGPGNLILEIEQPLK